MQSQVQGSLSMVNSEVTLYDIGLVSVCWTMIPVGPGGNSYIKMMDLLFGNFEKNP